MLMGEPPPWELCRKVATDPALLGGTRCSFFSIYGATEASSSAVLDMREYFRVVRGGRDAFPENDRRFPIGVSIQPDHIKFRVLTRAQDTAIVDRLELVAEGSTGGLFVSGPNLMTGYLIKNDGVLALDIAKFKEFSTNLNKVDAEPLDG